MLETVLVTKFNGDGTFDWSHNDGHSGQNVVTGNLIHGKKVDGTDDKTVLVVTDTVCGTESFYPMAGGPMAQQLHKEHLNADTLTNVQTDATARGIDTIGKTQAQLIAEIIQDECKKQDVGYLL